MQKERKPIGNPFVLYVKIRPVLFPLAGFLSEGSHVLVLFSAFLITKDSRVNQSLPGVL